MPSPARKTPQMLPGLKPVLELLRNSPGDIARLFCKKDLREFQKIAALAKAADIPLIASSQSELDRMCAGARANVAHQGLVAELSQKEPIPLASLLEESPNAPLPLIIALDQVKDPGNLGTLSRTAWALGAAGIILPEHESAKPGPAAMKSSAGALGLLPVCAVVNLARALDEAEERGFTIYGAGALAAKKPDLAFQNAFSMQWRLPAVLVLGSEASGMRPGVQKRCNIIVNIPFARGFDSLNIAQAGAILMGLCAAAQQTA